MAAAIAAGGGMMVPGTRLLSLATLWFDGPTVARIFEPLVADWQREWMDAPAGRKRWINLRGVIAFATTFLVAFAPALRAPIPGWLVRRILIRMAAFIAIVGIFALVPLWRSFGTQLWSPDASVLLMAVVVITPVVTFLTAFLPFAVAASVDAIRGNDLPPPAERAAVTRLVIVTTLWMIIGAGWVLPAMDQMWRASVIEAVAGADAGYPPPRGMRELSTYELVFHSDRAFVQPDRPVTWPAGREIARRAALLLMPLALVCLRWRAIAEWPLERMPRWTAAVAGILGLLTMLTMPPHQAMLAFLLLSAFAFVQPWRARRWKELAGRLR